MKQFMTAAAVTLTAATFATGAWAQAKTDVRIMWYSDGVEGQVIRELAGRFNQANPLNTTIEVASGVSTSMPADAGTAYFRSTKAAKPAKIDAIAAR